MRADLLEDRPGRPADRGPADLSGTDGTGDCCQTDQNSNASGPRTRLVTEPRSHVKEGLRHGLRGRQERTSFNSSRVELARALRHCRIDVSSVALHLARPLGSSQMQRQQRLVMSSGARSDRGRRRGFNEEPETYPGRHA